MRSILLADVLRQASFRLSAQNATHLPPDEGAEVAFAGRSNAGKSSALNVITGRKGLARVSKAPGRTRLINFFTIDDQHSLVDLPGYGYARVARSVRAEWDEMVGNYLHNRESLRGVVLIMDCRHPLTEYDEALLEYCTENSLLVHVLLSKCDKLNRNDQITIARCTHASRGTGCRRKRPIVFGTESRRRGRGPGHGRGLAWHYGKTCGQKKPRRQGERFRGV